MAATKAKAKKAARVKDLPARRLKPGKAAKVKGGWGGSSGGGVAPVKKT
jgi:hypothetical protein